MTTFFHKNINLLIIAVTIFGTSKLIANSNETTTIKFDAHVHLDQLDPEKAVTEVAAWLEKYKIQKSLLLSPSYLFNNEWDALNAPYKTLQDKSILAMNTILNKFPNSFIGLCGIDHVAPNILEYSQRCIEHELIKGYKIRLSWYQDYKDYLKIYDDVFEQNANKIKVALIHIPEFSGELEYEKASYKRDGKNTSEAYSRIYNNAYDFLTWLSTLAKKYPHIQFIIAHAGGFEDLITISTELKKQYHLDNLWLEVSTYLYFYPNKNKIDPLRSFGLNRVLFGTDMSVSKELSFLKNTPPHDNESQYKLYSSVANALIFTTELPETDKKMILEEAAEEFLRRVD